MLDCILSSSDFKNIPDFEQVNEVLSYCNVQIYHLVIDAVDEYNEKWEKAWNDQESALLEAEKQLELAALVIQIMFISKFLGGGK